MHHDIQISREEQKIEPEHALVGIGDTIQFHSDDAGFRIAFPEDKSPVEANSEEVEAGGSGDVHEIGDLEGAFEYTVHFSDLNLSGLIVVDEEGTEEEFEEFEETGNNDLAEAVNEITARVLDTIESAAAVRAGFFFPQGIDLIEVSVDIEGVKASVKIAGPAR
jgi:plastocyanin